MIINFDRLNIWVSLVNFEGLDVLIWIIILAFNCVWAAIISILIIKVGQLNGFKTFFDLVVFSLIRRVLLID